MISARMALKIARDAHEGQLRKHGGDYIWHPIAVANDPLVIRSGEELIACALLHDVVEDTDVSFEDLRQMGASPNQQNVIAAVTKLDNEPNVEYLERVKKYGGAVIVKRADSLHNYDELAVLLTLPGDNSNGETWRQTFKRLNVKYRSNILELEAHLNLPTDQRTQFADVDLSDFFN